MSIFLYANDELLQKWTKSSLKEAERLATSVLGQPNISCGKMNVVLYIFTVCQVQA